MNLKNRTKVSAAVTTATAKKVVSNTPDGRTTSGTVAVAPTVKI